MTIHNGSTVTTSGLYVHVPFCVKKCAYCDFYSLPGCTHRLNSYIDALFQEALQYRGMRFETLYIGGGTPSLLGVEGIKKLTNGLSDIFDLSRVIEATIEVNPDSATLEFLTAAKSCGLNRVSIGVQSLSDAELKTVGRIHDAAQAVSAIENTKKAGFVEVSSDAISGLPGQDWDSLKATLEKLVALDIAHLSLYCLSLEHGTPLAENPPENLPSEDTQAELFENATKLLTAYGFEHYEISNFARPGHESKHNLNYWRGGDYMGLGPSAASHLAGKRFKNKADLSAYLANPVGQIEDEETLDAVEKAAEEAMLRLRLLNEGLDIRTLARKFSEANIKALEERLGKLAAESLLLNEGTRYRLPPEYVLICNSILVRVIA
jgi:putative oxygen-independent coproporphyrinogen III oxidase